MKLTLTGKQAQQQPRRTSGGASTGSAGSGHPQMQKPPQHLSEQQVEVVKKQVEQPVPGQKQKKRRKSHQKPAPIDFSKVSLEDLASQIEQPDFKK